jgi:nitroreductase/NAD-dependent dihydropyrimidine dehydrogenase PreA subunit
VSVLIVDKAKCKRDAFCVEECPGLLIQIPENGFPEIRAGFEDGCVECGHCVAACPHDALSHKKVRIEDSPKIIEELKISMRQAEQFLRSRRSIRAYQAKPVDRNTIRKLIEIARYAPTSGNSQLVEWLVLTDRTKIKHIAAMTVDFARQIMRDPRMVAAAPYLGQMVARWDAGVDTILRDAPAIVIASAPEEAINGLGDVVLALSYLDLMAPTLGLGTCWAGLLYGAMLHDPSIKSAVGVPANHPHAYPIMLGYPDANYYRLPERRTPKIAFA